MAFNNLMHPRNIYKEKKPDFQQLYEKYEHFRQYCILEPSGKVTLDFQNPEAVRCLTSILLKDDFDLDVELPSHSLVPRLPGRLNYILWLEDLVQANRKSDTSISGIDIGTGSSCIYALLGVRRCSNWNFLATDKDSEAVQYAQRNVAKNSLESRITVTQVSENTALCGVVEKYPGRQFEFCMCNPPFYDTQSNDKPLGQKDRTNSRRPPHSMTLARSNEISAEGGECGFVSRIIEDSAKLKEKVRICTSMLGKKSSVAPLKDKLRHMGVCDMTDTTFHQGKTQRWAIAWTFDPTVKFSVERSNQDNQPSERNKQDKKQPSCLVFPGETHTWTIEAAANWLESVIKNLKITFEQAAPVSVGCRRYICKTFVNTWSGQRRKRRAFQRLDLESSEAKHPRKQGMVDIAVSADLGTGDGRDNYAGTSTSSEGFCTIEKSNFNTNGSRTVGVQAHVQSPTTSKDSSLPLAKFYVEINHNEQRVKAEFRWIEGHCRDSLNQIVQYCRNTIKKAHTQPAQPNVSSR